MRRILEAVRNPIHRGGFCLIYACGLRISAAASLPVTAIDKASGLLRVVGKGNVPANVVQTAQALALERRVSYYDFDQGVEAAAAAVFGW